MKMKMIEVNHNQVTDTMPVSGFICLASGCRLSAVSCQSFCHE